MKIVIFAANCSVFNRHVNVNVPRYWCLSIMVSLYIGTVTVNVFPRSMFPNPTTCPIITYTSCIDKQNALRRICNGDLKVIE